MEMEFVRHEPCYDRILFVLTLDRKKMKERILIGGRITGALSITGGYGCGCAVRYNTPAWNVPCRV